MDGNKKAAHVIRTAKDSTWNAKLWLRYIAKHFEEDKIPLTISELNYVLSCDELTLFQKCVLKQAYQTGTKTNQHVTRLSKRCDTSLVEKMLKKNKSE